MKLIVQGDDGSTGLYGAIMADCDPRCSDSCGKTPATWSKTVVFAGDTIAKEGGRHWRKNVRCSSATEAEDFGKKRFPGKHTSGIHPTEKTTLWLNTTHQTQITRRSFSLVSIAQQAASVLATPGGSSCGRHVPGGAIAAPATFTSTTAALATAAPVTAAPTTDAPTAVTSINIDYWDGRKRLGGVGGSAAATTATTPITTADHR